MELTKRKLKIRQQDSVGTPPRRSNRELLTEFAGEDIANKLTDDECATLNTCIAQLIRSVRQKDFDAGYYAGIDHTVDCVAVLFAPKTKAH